MRLALSVLPIVTVPLFIGSRGPSRPAPEAELRQLNDRFIEAVARRDTSTLSREVLASDFGFIGSDGGTLDRAHYLSIAADPAMSTYRHLSVDEVVIRVWGDAAVVNARTTWTLATPSGDKSGHSRFTDVYIRRNGKWRVVEAHLSRVAE